ncbi:MAG: helix-turn-helix transcriptional regulator [Erysipelotrichaceae bacterium]|nr:helix-turn-helix transcriptional regulator [Erysipelotrichaceae bacterium]
MGNEVFKKRISELRKKKGLTLEELGKLVGLGKNTVYYWEDKGTVPNDSVLLKLSEIFDESIDYLLGNDKRASQRQAAFRNWNKLTDEEKEKAMKIIDAFVPNANKEEESEDEDV